MVGLPQVLHFEGIGACFYECTEFRKPRQGEFYISGAYPAAYRAPNDLSMHYHIAVPKWHAKRARLWTMGDAISDQERSGASKSDQERS